MSNKFCPRKPIRTDRIMNSVPVRPGQKVKVYNDPYEPRYGEVVGVRERNGRILILERPSFATLTTSQFDHFRDITQVTFIQDDEDVMRFTRGTHFRKSDGTWVRKGGSNG